MRRRALGRRKGRAGRGRRILQIMPTREKGGQGDKGKRKQQGGGCDGGRASRRGKRVPCTWTTSSRRAQIIAGVGHDRANNVAVVVRNREWMSRGAVFVLPHFTRLRSDSAGCLRPRQ